MAEHRGNNSTELTVTTRLALDRTRIAYEGPMVVNVRPATSFITFGFAVYKFFEIETVGLDIGPRLIGSRGFAITLIALGLLTLLIGRIEHSRDLRALKKYYPDMPISGTQLIAVLIALIGTVAFIAVLLRA